MGRESAITQEEVNAVADQLLAAGIKPTARATREALGRGSMATVLRHLQFWQSRQVRPSETQTSLPASLQRSLLDFIAQETAAAKATVEAELASTQQTNQDLIAESERLAAALERERETVHNLQADKAELTGRLSQLAQDLEAAKKEAAVQREAAELARTERAKAELRLEGVPKLEAETNRLRNALEDERAGKTSAEQQAAVAQARLEKTEAQVADLVARLTKAESWLDDLRNKNIQSSRS